MEIESTKSNGSPRRSRDHIVDSMTTYLVDEHGMKESAARAEADVVVREAGELRGVLGEMWWTILLRGIIAIGAGLIFLTRPISALATLVVFLGAWVFVDGVITLISGIARHKSPHLAFVGGISALLGYMILTRPTSAALVFFILVAAWAMSHGVTEIALGASLRRGTAGRVALIVMGIVSFAFGLLLIAAPLVGLAALGLYIGCFALFSGVMLIVLAFQVRGIKHELAELPFAHGSAQPQHS